MKTKNSIVRISLPLAVLAAVAVGCAAGPVGTSMNGGPAEGGKFDDGSRPNTIDHSYAGYQALFDAGTPLTSVDDYRQISRFGTEFPDGIRTFACSFAMPGLRDAEGVTTVPHSGQRQFFGLTGTQWCRANPAHPECWCSITGVHSTVDHNYNFAWPQSRPNMRTIDGVQELVDEADPESRDVDADGNPSIHNRFRIAPQWIQDEVGMSLIVELVPTYYRDASHDVENRKVGYAFCHELPRPECGLSGTLEERVADCDLSVLRQPVAAGIEPTREPLRNLAQLELAADEYEWQLVSRVKVTADDFDAAGWEFKGTFFTRDSNRDAWFHFVETWVHSWYGEGGEERVFITSGIMNSGLRTVLADGDGVYEEDLPVEHFCGDATVMVLNTAGVQGADEESLSWHLPSNYEMANLYGSFPGGRRGRATGTGHGQASFGGQSYARSWTPETLATSRRTRTLEDSSVLCVAYGGQWTDPNNGRVARRPSEAWEITYPFLEESAERAFQTLTDAAPPGLFYRYEAPPRP